MIKDNHIRAAGGIRRAVEAARKNITHTLKIEVEVENLEMVDEALACGADIIMLDNMSLSEMNEAVRALTAALWNRPAIGGQGFKGRCRNRHRHHFRRRPDPYHPRRRHQPAAAGPVTIVGGIF